MNEKEKLHNELEENYEKIVEMLSNGNFLQLNGKAINLTELNEYINAQQEEIERLKEEYVMLQNASDKVEEEKDKEIERLKDDNKYLNKVNIELSSEKNRLKSIIKEVREYIETNKENTTQTLRFDENKSYNTALLELLGILDKVGEE